MEDSARTDARASRGLEGRAVDRRGEGDDCVPSGKLWAALLIDFGELKVTGAVIKGEHDNGRAKMTMQSSLEVDSIAGPCKFASQGSGGLQNETRVVTHLKG